MKCLMIVTLLLMSCVGWAEEADVYVIVRDDGIVKYDCNKEAAEWDEIQRLGRNENKRWPGPTAEEHYKLYKRFEEAQRRLTECVYNNKKEANH